ncbi:hypothetical protein M3Y94_00698600 [Aphelenchoides besseyi]|nr:hypothetical protein M3Y94_00698600 [Aphelenchoides besseyi]
MVFAFWQPAILPPFFGGYCLGLFKYVPFGFLLGVNAFELTPAQYKTMNLDSLRMKHPSMVLMPMHNRIEVGFVTALVFTLTVLSVCFSVFACWASYRTIRKTSDVVQPKTVEMQKAVQRILSAQLLTGILFYYLPMGIISVNILMYQKSEYDGGFFVSQLSMLLFPLFLPSHWVISFVRFPQFRLMLKSWVGPKDSTQRNSLT